MATHNIIKLPSGFCGLQVISSGQYCKADLIPWDGNRGTDYPYNVNNANFEYYIDAKNTIYYTDRGGIDARIWCAGKELNAHCKRLNQIKNWR